MATKADNQASEKAVDEAFQTLLSSQRGILKKMNFGNSNSEMQFTDGPDNLPLVSPHASAEFENSYSGYHYHQQSQYYYQETLLEESTRHSMSRGNDRLFLESIALGPEIFDDETEARMRRKRETEQEFMEVVAQRRRKKQRRGSVTIITKPKPSLSDDLLPGPGDLDLDLNFDDDSANSLLLEDLEFPSMHSRGASNTSAAPEIYEELPMEETNDDELETPTVEDEPAIDVAIPKPEDPPSAPERSQLNMWKPRPRKSVTEGSATDANSAKKADQKAEKVTPKAPEKVCNSVPMSDSCDSLKVDGLSSPMRGVSRTSSSQSQPSTMQVSARDGDMDLDMAAVRGRANSSDSAADPQALSVALQQSIGSMKSIEEWDKKFGLKRSHSKTMRLSSKSREQLLAFFGDKISPSVSPRSSTPPASSTETKQEQKEKKETVDEPPMVEA